MITCVRSIFLMNSERSLVPIPRPHPLFGDDNRILLTFDLSAAFGLELNINPANVDRAMSDKLVCLVDNVRSLNGAQFKLLQQIQDLQLRLESELDREDKRFVDETKELRESVLCCPPTLVKVTPNSPDGTCQRELYLDRNNQWTSSYFYTHPLGYKLCLVLKSTELLPLYMPRCEHKYTRKPQLAIKIMALSQVDSDQHRTWPCEGEITLKIIGQRKCNSFTTKFSIRQPVDTPDSVLSEIEEWVDLPEDAIPFGQYYSPYLNYTTHAIPKLKL